MMDMGSGGGLPGIPLAIAVPSLGVVSIDSVGKKINFQKHIKRLLNLKNFTALQCRLEDLKPENLGQKKYDLVVSRAFSSLETSIRSGTPWLQSGGRLIAMKGPEGQDEIRGVKKLIKEYQLTDPLVFSYLLPYSRAERQLIILTSLQLKDFNNK
jgi:16S rRNA (guanine527-N7)-methyltransferase